ncbi:hypothetical protein K3G39_14500 [Pontibacter sp. HSC-14F20]|uniref:hypothetical protein n=1 Tax=Pontibacter sp. HSC-14F20 TaxID=2864136 RepID=UPI001C72B163|nr:hypothetical protein [Pontibacter sp. HSC-14F20]MBX0334449.1 hypothetical protein [Pontibacter sp. HSC-14F20]
MKRLSTITIALLMIAGTFTSCTKDLDEVGLNASSIDAAKGGVTDNNSDKKLAPVITINFSESPAVVGRPVTISITVTEPSASEEKLTSGNLILQRMTDLGWESVAHSDEKKAAPTLSYTFTPDAAGTIQWNTKYTGGGKSFENTDTKVDLEVLDNCQNTELRGELISSTKYVGYTEYTVKYTFKSCITINGAKIQGGLTAFTELVSAIDSKNVEANEEDTAIGNDKSNSKISWQLGNIASGYNNTFTITFKNFKKNQEDEITGGWSVEGTDNAGEKVKVVAAPITLN